MLSLWKKFGCAALCLFVSLAGLQAQSQDPPPEQPVVPYQPQHDVSSAGSFQWSYPINIPMGTNSMQPSLTISYNSNAPDGMLGMGFSLSGLSTIERDTSRGIHFDSTDTYVLDGQKLYFDSGSTDKRFHLEQESYDKIQAFLTNNASVPVADPNNALAFWVVSKKDGSKWYYGNISSSDTSAATIPIFNQSLPRLWALSKVMDSNGNYYNIRYLYDTASGAYYPGKIIYTLGNDLATTKTVQFSYEDRADRPIVYTPTQVRTTLRLSWISLLVGTNASGDNGALFRKYHVSYSDVTNGSTNSSTRRSRVTAIQEYGYDGNWPAMGHITSYSPTGSTLPATQFTYPDDSADFAFPLITSTSGINGVDLSSPADKIVTADFNGDGKTDILVYRPKYQNPYDTSVVVAGGPIHAGFSNGDGTFTWAYANSNGVIGFDLSTKEDTILTGDFNGDGKSDILCYRTAHAEDFNSTVFAIGLSTGHTGSTLFTRSYFSDSIVGSSGGTVYLDSSNDKILVADFNGDRKTDILVYRPGQGAVHVGYSNGDGTFSWAYASSSGILGLDFASTQDQILTADFNGDGKSDILCYRTGQFLAPWLPGGQSYIGLSTGKTSAAMFTQVFQSSTGILGLDLTKKGDQIVPTDFNGDGKTDLLVYRSGVSTPICNIGLSAGDGTFNQISAANGIAGVDLTGADDHLVPADFNGDGKTDILAYRLAGTPTICHIGLSTGEGTFTQTDAGSNIVGLNTSSLGDIVLTADLLGIGKNDIIRFRPGSGNSSWIGLQSTVLSDLVAKITLPTGGTIAPIYIPAPLVAGAVVPTNSDYSTGVANATPRPLVTSITMSSAIAGATDIVTTYQYSNGLTLPGTADKVKDLGFQTLTKTVANTVTISTYNQTLPLEGRVSDVLVKAGSTGAKYAETVYTYQDRQDDPTDLPDVHFTVTATTTSKKFDGLSTSDNTRVDTQLSDYDAYGNLLVTRNLGRVDGSGNPIDASGALSDLGRTQNETTYAMNTSGDTYLFRVSVKKTSSYDVNGNWGIQSQTLYYYDGNSVQGVLGTKGQLTKERDYIDDAPHWAETTMDYDAWGNLYHVWDPRLNDGDYGSTVNDDTTATSKTVFDAVYHAQPASQTNALGQITNYAYDSILRPYTVTDPNLQITTTSYDVFSRTTRKVLPLDSSANQTSKTLYTNVAVSNGVITSPSIVRSMQKTSATDTPVYLSSYTYLDGLGRTLQTKRQAVSGWTTQDYTYDAAGRNLSVSAPYVTASQTYSAADASQKTTQFTYDVLGRLVTTTNTDGTTHQTIYSQVTTWSVDENGHAKVTYNYGNYVRQRDTKGVYPSSTAYSTVGTHVYRGLSTTVTENYTDTAYTYVDELGRRTQYSGPDVGSWSYSYDKDGNLKAQTDALGHTINFTYDKLNRLLSRTSADTSINATFAYDQVGQGSGAIGHLTAATYNNGSDSYEYDARGRVTKQIRTLDGKIKVMQFSYDSADRTVTQIYPDNEIVTSGYGIDGNLVSLTGVAGSSTTYYVTGITYKPYGKVESMTYGKGATQSGGNTTTYSYYDAADQSDPFALTTFSYRLRKITAGTSASLLNLTYSYEKNDNVHMRSDLNTGNNSETYTYDELNRLIVAGSGVSGTLNFGYDPQNNIGSKDGYTYDYQSKPHAVVNNQLYTYTYDANGNMTARSGGRSIAYDYENRVTSISDDGTYSYDTGRQRTIKTVGTKTTYYFFPDYQEEWTSGAQSSVLKYYRANQQLVAQNVSPSGLAYIYGDHLGSSTVMTNATGTVIRTQGYKPYGTDSYLTGSASTKYQFTGQEKDAEGLYYYNARYYDPSLGRFIQPDPAIWSGEVSARLSLWESMNPYLYAMDNPISYTDPTGLFIMQIGSYYTMNQGAWAGSNLGKSKTILMRKEGCAVTAVANVLRTAGMNVDPGTLNGQKGLFSGEAGTSFNWITSVAGSGLKYGSFAGTSSELTAKIHELSNSWSSEYAIVAHVDIDGNGSNNDHWVPGNGTETFDGKDYLRIVQSSSSDGASGTRLQTGWVEKDGQIYVPMSAVSEIKTYEKPTLIGALSDWLKSLSSESSSGSN